MTALSEPTIGVLALQGDVAEHVRALTTLGVAVGTVRTPKQLAGVDALIIPGGESTAMSKLLGVTEMFIPISEAIENGMPVYGSCAGMIMLASNILDTRADAVSFSAIDMTVRRNAFGRQVDSFETDITITGITDGQPPFHAVFIRAPWVESVGPDVQVLAQVQVQLPSGETGHPIVAVRQNNVLATSFHPEVTGDLRIHQEFVNIVTAHLQGR